jgi:hypothetical protein
MIGLLIARESAYSADYYPPWRVVPQDWFLHSCCRVQSGAVFQQPILILLLKKIEVNSDIFFLFPSPCIAAE